MENQNERDELLFDQLKKIKRRKRRKVIITVVTILVLAGVGVTAAVTMLRARVRTQFAASTVEVKSYQAQHGRISTTVSGSGTLSYVDYEDITVPDGVELDEILVSAGDVVAKGDAIATVDPDTVLSALATNQTGLEDLAKQIDKAKNDTANTYVSAPVTGRMKAVYVTSGDNVVDVMTKHGALAVISLDGKMKLTVDAALQAGSEVTVVTDEKEYPGTVESTAGGKSVILLTDNGPADGASASVKDSSGKTVGTGTLEINTPLAITGYAGTVGWISTQENAPVFTGSSLFTLSGTQYSATYDTLVRQRSEAEKTMNELIGLLQTGFVAAPFDGIITNVADASADASYDLSAYIGQSSTNTGSALATIAPNKQVSVSVSVDETDILSLELGQTAEITVSSIGEDVYPGKVTEISKIGVSASGVTQYTAVVSLDKAEQMLSGMTASVDIQIQGVDDVVLIPADALRQTRNTSYVFTSYDEELKEYGGMVEVVTGASNSSYVEIVSGLKPGDTVYYTEKSNNNPFSMMPMGNFGGGNFGNNRGGMSGNRGGMNGGNRQGSGMNSGNSGANRPGMGG